MSKQQSDSVKQQYTWDELVSECYEKITKAKELLEKSPSLSRKNLVELTDLIMFANCLAVELLNRIVLQQPPKK